MRALCATRLHYHTWPDGKCLNSGHLTVWRTLFFKCVCPWNDTFATIERNQDVTQSIDGTHNTLRLLAPGLKRTHSVKFAD